MKTTISKTKLVETKLVKTTLVKTKLVKTTLVKTTQLQADPVFMILCEPKVYKKIFKLGNAQKKIC